MATLQEINAVMSGFSYSLRWTDFTTVQSSRNPPRQALTSSSYSLTGGRVALVNGNYRVQGFTVRVSVNRSASWAVRSAQSATLLKHEQGHYDITALIARDLARKVLDLSVSADVIAVVRNAGSTPQQRMQYVWNDFQRSINLFGQAATTLMDRLQSNNRSGLYDTQTNHGTNATAQARWDANFRRLKTGNEDFDLWLAIGMI